VATDSGIDIIRGFSIITLVAERQPMMGFIQQLHWREPLWLLLALQPLFVWLVVRLLQGGQLSTYAQRDLQPWVVVHDANSWSRRLLSRNSAYVLAWLLFALAAAGPRLPLFTPHVNPDKGMNILVIMDVSRSMTVNDVMPNRMRRAELELHELLARAQGQRVGVIVYAARPHVFVPLTWDFGALRYYLQSLDKLVLPTRGSNLTEALKLARDTLIAAPQFPTLPAAIVLISDGDSSTPFDVSKAQLDTMAQELKQQELPVYVLGVGSTEGSSIPLEDGGWLSYENRPVISRMQESVLRQLAIATGGRYSRATEDDSDWRHLYDAGMLTRLTQVEESDRVWLELYPWVLCPAIVLFFIAIMPLRLRKSVISKAVSFTAAAGLVLAGLLTQNVSRAAELSVGPSLEKKAYQAYQQEDFESAGQLYATVPGVSGRLGQGAAYYRLGDYPAAMRRFSDAVLQAENDQQRADALFNLGNSYFQQGDYQTAARTFADVLRYQKNHPAARHNLAISQSLYQQVTQVLVEQDDATLAGRGPRNARPVEDINLSDEASLAIDESEEDQTTIIPQLPEDEQEEWQELIRKGLEFVQVAASGDTREGLQQRQQDLAKARLFMLQIEDQPATLWQRMFEQEEGFIAPQSEPNEIPGVQPW
jgi:Ca-activated chloride channel family protein